MPNLYLQALNELEDTPIFHYDRKFFKHWEDFNKDRCSTRFEVLNRDNQGTINYGDGCQITKGEWESPYDNKSYTNAEKVEVDHVVPLDNAWLSGAYDWSQKERDVYANDMTLGHLLSVDKISNVEKSYKSPDMWMPKNEDFLCDYAAAWISIKHRWNLKVTKAERQKLNSILQNCRSAVDDYPISTKGISRQLALNDPELPELGITEQENNIRKNKLQTYKNKYKKCSNIKGNTKNISSLRKDIENDAKYFGINNIGPLSSKSTNTLCEIVGLPEN